MKPFPEHDREWVESLPFYGTIQRDECGRLTRVTTWLFPGSKPHKREVIEEGFAPSREATPEDRWFNAMMTENVAAFSDIISAYTGQMYGRARNVAIFRILSLAWQRAGEPGVGTRAWMHGVCREAMGDAHLFV
ncbi:MAG: hypothetical protein LLG14_27430 [Nocardiaceae bacterium]|nr:hypothetical protein [Nocardiaceae bacterium]